MIKWPNNKKLNSKNCNIRTKKLIYNVSVKRKFNLSTKLIHSHKKRKDSLEDSLDRVLFGAEPEFSKILVPRLAQHN